MNYKRVISTSVSDLHLNSVSDSIKRLAISHDGHPEKAMNISDPDSLPKQHVGILTVMSSARDDFSSKYEVLREIGKGGFSTVYQCRNKNTGMDYAVKFVDLRPLRLRERFNPLRLRREVDIMKRLHHSNIIQFVDVFEDNDNLMMIMEYCPGKELFDVILERKYFEESDARPIFSQIARALFYLHSLNILHRDVKPENILISSIPDHTGQVVAKLLDFGLSKNAGNGSAAKTFVGTPCYVAPEVEYTSKGLGGTYSFPADCWSLGAVLYVMLVARFPEFEQDPTGKIVVKLSPGLWGNVSSDAKDLIRSLMNTNPAARLSMASTLMHPWLGRYRATQEELSRVSVVNYDLNRRLQEEESRLEAEERKARAAANKHNNRPQQAQQGQNNKLNSLGELDVIDEDIEDIEINSSGVVVHHQAMVVRGAGTEAVVATIKPDAGIQLAPLLHLQRSIATCFDEVHASYQDMPEVASEIREGASLCREQLTQSLKMLRKVEQTAAAVLNMFPDLELAIEEGEPQLAANFFATVKEWVTDLRELVNSTQSINKASMQQIQLIVERSTIGLLAREKQKKQIASNTINVPRKLLDTAMQRMGLADKACCLIGNGEDCDEIDPAADTVELDANHILDLFMTLFGSGPKTVSGVGSPRPNNVSLNPPKSPQHDEFFGRPARAYSIDSDTQSPQTMHHSTSSGGSSLTKLASHTGTATVLRGSAATSSILLHHNSHTSNNSNTSTTSTVSANRDRSDTEEEMSEEVDQSMDSPSTSPSPSPSPSPATPGETPTRVYPVTDSKYVYAMDLDEDVERNDSYGSTISLETFAPLPQGVAIPVPPVNPNTSSTKGSMPIPRPLLMDSDKPASAKSSKQHADAAAHLADALNKLRQVDVILEELSVFWANTEVVLDLLTKKGQHVEQFIGFASKPKLMARFLERMEEYKRFWENVSMMCSNYIAGVQTTNDEQRMYGFLDSDSMKSSSSTASGSAHSTPSHYMQSHVSRPGGGGTPVPDTTNKRPSYMTPTK